MHYFLLFTSIILILILCVGIDFVNKFLHVPTTNQRDGSNGLYVQKAVKKIRKNRQSPFYPKFRKNHHFYTNNFRKV